MPRNWFTRRDLLTTIGGSAAVTALAPFIPRLEEEAHASGVGAPLRYLYWYEGTMPKSSIVDPAMPTSLGPLQFPSGQPLAPLNAVKDKLLMIRGLDNVAGRQTGLPGGHEPAGVSMLSGWRLGEKLATDTDVESGMGFRGTSTLDQWIAQKLRSEQGVSTPLTDIRAGYRNTRKSRENISRTVSFLDGVLRPRHQEPRLLYEEMFPFATKSDVVGPPAYVGKRRRVLDYVRGEVHSVQKRISKFDRERLDQHLTAIAEIEDQLDAIEQYANDTTRDCSLDADLDAATEQLPAVQEAYMRLIKQAFVCDMTRVAGAMFSTHLTGLHYSHLPEYEVAKDNYHKATHDSNEVVGAEAYCSAVMRWRAGQYVKLIQSLDEVVEENGKTLLDNTIVHIFTETSRSHDWHDVFTLIAGGGGYFKLGRMETVTATLEEATTRSKNKPLNSLFTSIAHAFGFELDFFGDPAFGSGGLPARFLV